jgi:hypothetical protein
MKQYIDKTINSENILEGFKPICNSNLFTTEELEKIALFVNNNTVTKTIDVNPDIDEDEDFEEDYEIFGGDINLICVDISEGEALAEEFSELTLMRCSVNDFKDGVAYCDFESE